MWTSQVRAVPFLIVALGGGRICKIVNTPYSCRKNVGVGSETGEKIEKKCGGGGSEKFSFPPRATIKNGTALICSVEIAGV